MREKGNLNGPWIESFIYWITLLQTNFLISLIACVNQNEKKGLTISRADIILGEKFFIFNKEASLKFEEGKPLYFFSGPNAIIFKSRYLSKKFDHIVADYPESMQIEESRETKRFYFRAASRFLNFSKKIINLDLDSKTQWFNLKIIDFPIKAILIPHQNDSPPKYPNYS